MKIEIQDFSFSYPQSRVPALNHVTMTVQSGEVILLCGASGSGKSTLLRCLKKELCPAGTRTGAVFLDGRSMEELSASDVGFVMQNPENQIVCEDVRHELAFGLENLGVKRSEMFVRLAETADFFGISPLCKRKTGELSGGEKQLLNLAAVMAMQPKVLLLDEPFAQLDPVAAANLADMIFRINREFRTTVILSEHRPESLFMRANRVAVMEKGSLLCADAPQKTADFLLESGHPMQKALPLSEKMRFFTNHNLSLPPKPPRTFAADSEPKPVARRVWFSYDKNDDVLKDLSLSLSAGRLYCILGANGSGKSTLLSVLAKHLRPWAGKVTTEANTALLPQNPQSLFSAMSIEEELSGQLPDFWKPYAARHPFDLSGGEQQLLALDKVLMLAPDLLLADEPTKGLDAFFRKQVGARLQSWCAQGKTVAVVTHDTEFAAENADFCAVMFDGQISEWEPPSQFFSRHLFYSTPASRLTGGRAVTEREALQLCQE